jgi:hypothetical protein
MSNPFAWIGAAVLLAGVLGSTPHFDFVLCFGPSGYCEVTTKDHP